ncbi:hypothetical protein J8J42_11490 [Chryseobacterium sp. cx-311]|uniref:hypothetical protein n=1 Tax=Marnyiella aurantia TaxID=2758037 RepID=UPI001AE162CD|nr:hypothetical protein [Marnyiella aurantia]MBP0613661.1 hypothetical protein [Marnyiella aurantia]
MKIYRNTNNRNLIAEKIKPTIERLKQDDNENQKKIIEVCHVGKFLSLLDAEIYINRISEEPDFILNYGNKIIGLEHQVIVNNEIIEVEGFYKNIFQKVESKLQNETPSTNFLANCFLKEDLKVRLKDKQNLIDQVFESINEFLKHGTLIENEIIYEILTIPHKKISLCPNFGGWMQKTISEEIIISAINKKEKKLSNYIGNCGKRQWLLMVIGGVGATSYEMDEYLNLNIISKFEEIYILEDFNNILYKIK